MEDVIINVTQLEPRLKHPTIFDAFDHLNAGVAVVIHNDHDPKPLYYQLLAERGNCFSWTYLSEGPQEWQVEIRKHNTDTETVGEIAAKDMRKAARLKELGIDFCCGGKKSLQQACQDKGLDVIKVQQELEDATRQPVSANPLNFNSLSLSFLADYIVNVHHAYVIEQAPVIEDLAQKVVGHHGGHIPALPRVYQMMASLRAELFNHMEKEEQVLFPTIKLIEAGGAGSVASISELIHLMESEHDIAGDLIKEIRFLTHDFTAPEEACNSMKILYYKLEEFEHDLLQHIHLENNILFPKAITMQESNSRV